MNYSSPASDVSRRAGPNLRKLRLLVDSLNLWRALAWLCALLLLAPVAFVLWGVATKADGGSWEHVRSTLLGTALRETSIVVGGVCLLALLLGVSTAWCISHYQFPGRRLFSVLLVLPLAVPPYVAAYATTEAREAFIPTLVSVRLEQGVDAYLKLEQVHRFSWLIVIFAAVLYPYVFLACRAAFSGATRKLSEASRTLGVGRWRTFWRVDLPMARPALVAGLFLVAMEVLNDYGAVHHLGVNTFTVIIFRSWFGLGELETARRLAGWVLIGVFALVLIERSQRGRRDRSSDRQLGPPRHRCGVKGSLACSLVCLIPVIVGLFYPLRVLLHWWSSATQNESSASIINAAKHSLWLGFGVTTACLLAGMIVAGIGRLSKRRMDGSLAQVAGIAGYASPGAVMAVGVLGIAALLRARFSPESWISTNLLADSILFLGFALTARYLAISTQMIRQNHRSFPQTYDDASNMLGCGRVATFFRIHIPLLRPALAGAAVLIFVDVCKELPLCLLLRPFDFETLGTLTFGLVDQGQIMACAAPSLALIGLCAAGLATVELAGWRRQ